MRISSPPTTHSCYFGIDTPEREKLLAIVEQVKLVMDGEMSPRDIAPHLTHETDEPQGE